MTDFEQMITKKTMQDYLSYLSYKVSGRTGIDTDDIRQELMLTAWKEFEKFKNEENPIKFVLSGLSYKAGKMVFIEYKKASVRRRVNPVVYNSLLGFTESEENLIMARLVLSELRSTLTGRQLTVFSYLERGFRSTEIQDRLSLHPYTYSCTLKKIQAKAEKAFASV